MATTAPPVAATATAPSVAELCLAARDASRALAALPTGTKDAALHAIADALEARLEIMGDELLDLLERANLKVPEFDLADEDAWPPAEFAAARVGGPSQQPALPAPSPSQNGAPTT